jgi:Cu-Zn family superoxide dismutase
MKTRRIAALILAVGALTLTGGPSLSAQGVPALAQEVARARAAINSCTDGSLVGSATLFETPSAEGVKNVSILLSVRNLAEGKHAVHIHEVGACTPTCAAAGSHLDLGPFGSNVPVTANHPYHSGDLINVHAGSNGNGFMHHVSSRIALSEGNLSIFDANGASVVIHALPDTYCADSSDPNCAGGGRVACGIIERIQ